VLEQEVLVSDDPEIETALGVAAIALLSAARLITGAAELGVVLALGHAGETAAPEALRAAVFGRLEGLAILLPGLRDRTFREGDQLQPNRGLALVGRSLGLRVGRAARREVPVSHVAAALASALALAAHPEHLGDRAHLAPRAPGHGKGAHGGAAHEVSGAIAAPHERRRREVGYGGGLLAYAYEGQVERGIAGEPCAELSPAEGEVGFDLVSALQLHHVLLARDAGEAVARDYLGRFPLLDDDALPATTHNG